VRIGISVRTATTDAVRYSTVALILIKTNLIQNWRNHARVIGPLWTTSFWKLVEIHLVDVTPTPGFPWLNGSHDRMTSCVEVGSRMTIL
jgi:hypothetical protein